MTASHSRPRSTSIPSGAFRSPCSASTPSGGSPDLPRVNVVTWSPFASAASTMPRPRNLVPPSTSSRMRPTLPVRPDPGQGCPRGANSADLDALPEGDPVGDLLGRVLRLRVVPERVLVDLAVHVERLVARGALPRADRVRVGVAEELRAARLAGEVVVALHDHGVVALGDDLAVPDGLRHRCLLARIPEQPATGAGNFTLRGLRPPSAPRSKVLRAVSPSGGCAPRVPPVRRSFGLCHPQGAAPPECPPFEGPSGCVTLRGLRPPSAPNLRPVPVISPSGGCAPRVPPVRRSFGLCHPQGAAPPECPPFEGPSGCVTLRGLRPPSAPRSKVLRAVSPSGGCAPRVPPVRRSFGLCHPQGAAPPECPPFEGPSGCVTLRGLRPPSAPRSKVLRAVSPSGGCAPRVPPVRRSFGLCHPQGAAPPECPPFEGPSGCVTLRGLRPGAWRMVALRGCASRVGPVGRSLGCVAVPGACGILTSGGSAPRVPP